MEEELEGLVKSLRHVLQNHARDPVRVRHFVVRDAPEDLLHDRWGDAARDHWDCVLVLERNAKVSWERCSVLECGVRWHDMGLKFLHMCDNPRRVYRDAARGFVSEDREARGEGLGIVLLRRGS